MSLHEMVHPIPRRLTRSEVNKIEAPPPRLSARRKGGTGHHGDPLLLLRSLLAQPGLNQWTLTRINAHYACLLSTTAWVPRARARPQRCLFLSVVSSLRKWYSSVSLGRPHSCFLAASSGERGEGVNALVHVNDFRLCAATALSFKGSSVKTVRFIITDCPSASCHFNTLHYCPGAFNRS